MDIRPARPEDAETIVRFIGELAAYEKLEHEMKADPAALREHLFGPQPGCAAVLAWDGDAPVGFALWFWTYSTFETAVCVHLEDLYVQEAHRGQGHGKALLQHVAGVARELGAPRLQWCVLDWNQPAIDFYASLGAELLPDWRIVRTTGGVLARLAETS